MRPSAGEASGRSGPMRTCVGCRHRDEQAALLRVVAEAVGPDESPRGVVLVPDQRRQRPGRGAYVHPEPGCVQRALQRNAFGRALRTTQAPDGGRLRAWLAQQA